ncbi:MAG: fumarylacetoacetate hydrolase family protein [Oscillospiraceae bacterium]|nr:fumarylacetoacetate hydrolase family protein [Oscillospiraceae bacterium]
MRYVRFESTGGPRWGVVKGEEVLTLSKPPYGELDYDGGKLPLGQCKLLAPCDPTKIVCVGKNYVDHAREMGAEPPGFPVLFLKGPNTLNRPEGAVCAPKFVERLDYEGELAVVIRRRAKDVKAKDFSDYVLGYTCLNDVTARDIQGHDGQWIRGKSMDGFCPIGPWVSDEVDPAGLKLATRLNGKTVQQGDTADFITSIPQLLEFIAAAMTLEPGDVVATGTPAGVGPMIPGDQVEVEIEGIGVLKNQVI